MSVELDCFGGTDAGVSLQRDIEAGSAIRETILVFLVIFILILLSALRKMTMASPMELLRSEHTGEKPPKGNWLLALVGVVVLAIAYGLAVTIEDPVVALAWFFAAVILVS